MKDVLRNENVFRGNGVYLSYLQAESTQMRGGTRIQVLNLARKRRLLAISAGGIQSNTWRDADLVRGGTHLIRGGTHLVRGGA